MTLYLPQKYKVISGKGRHLGLCTVWSDPETLVKVHPEILKKFAIIGTLYSKEGVSIMVRNLCLNPQINHVLVWANGPLSKTPFGSAGREALGALWADGIGSDNTISQVSHRLHAEIDANTVGKVISNVRLIDVSDMDMEDIIAKTAELEPGKPYMEPVGFPEAKRESDRTFPSEEVGWIVRGNKVVDAWLKVVDRILRYGTVKSTEYGNKQKELSGVTWVIENENLNDPYIPDWPKNLLKNISLDKKSLKKYYEVFMVPDLPRGTVYTYGQRLRAYPVSDNGKLDQIELMINKIKKNPNTRRAVAITTHPPEDMRHHSPPCLTQVQVLINNNRLDMLAVFRSHDIFKAAIANAFGLIALQSYVSDKTGYDIGKLLITSNSAHIYEEDWDDAKKLVKCQIWDRPVRLKFDEKNNADPRGYLVVSTIDKEISAEFFSPDGDILFEFRGKTPREIMLKFARLDLLSLPEHYGDLAEQLTRAETAIRLGIPFKQDRPLDLSNIQPI